MNLCQCLVPSFSCSASRKKTEKHSLKIHRHNKPNSPYPKSSPTPLLPARKTQPESRTHALDAVVNQLEAAASNGIVLNDPQTFASLLETCFRLKSLHHGLRIHKLIPETLLRKNEGVASKLLRLYASTGQLENAHEMFDQMPDRSTFVWNSLISGYTDAGSHEDALALYFQMAEEGVCPDQHTFPRALKACGGLGSVRVGEEIHRHVIKLGFSKNAFVANALVDMYAKCGNISRARRVFDAIEWKELVTWNSMINGYLKHGLVSKAWSVLRKMVEEGCEPDPVTMSAVLTGGPHYRIGTQIHGWAVRRGLDWDLSVANSLIVFYSGRRISGRARWLFERMPKKDVVSWNSVISAHTNDQLALEYFNRMTEYSDVSPDGITFVSLLSACARLGKVREGERIFSEMEEKYGVRPCAEHYACMVNLYGRAGLIGEAYEFIVEKMGDEEAGPTAWGALLYGCYLHGDADVGGIAGARLFELEPDVERNFELLIEIYREAGRDGDAERVRSMMMERGLGV
ncbi:Pentatricopeptide repeat-containing protein -chloroplastic [Striga hermonthica]|uniref:Pentatricopeptide repeat-containing protein -chloroplastic n=1 Tax=Striga hermonthica TaxID=68872 RepID=A0A9N7RLK8_STRHE|nr:Pentatricopeptide repeat-containing protein -chloroplastic [Striga hermonthica]